MSLIFVLVDIRVFGYSGWTQALAVWAQLLILVVFWCFLTSYRSRIRGRSVSLLYFSLLLSELQIAPVCHPEWCLNSLIAAGGRSKVWKRSCGLPGGDLSGDTEAPCSVEACNAANRRNAHFEKASSLLCISCELIYLSIHPSSKPAGFPFGVRGIPEPPPATKGPRRGSARTIRLSVRKQHLPVLFDI